MFLLSICIIALLCHGFAAASYSCVDFNVPMSFEAESLTINFPRFQNHYQSVQFLNDLTARNALSGPSPFGAPVNISVDVTVAAKYCCPKGHSGKIVQVLTHGIGFDHSYWDFGGPSSQYNYIKAATEAGYATLSYDRIGTGKSTKTDPYTGQQLGIETQVLASLTTLLREGKLSKIAKSHIRTPSKVVHVGHSFGSSISETLISVAPTLSDGVILTGFSTNGTYAPEFFISTNLHLAGETDPARFGDFPDGYLTWGDELANQYSFFHYPEFDPKVLAEAEATKMPFGISEPLTATVVSKAADFAGPLLIISGKYDRIFCGADCSGILEQAKPYFPKASPFETVVVEDIGHGMNLHYGAAGFYKTINDFVKSNVG